MTKTERALASPLLYQHMFYVYVHFVCMTVDRLASFYNNNNITSYMYHHNELVSGRPTPQRQRPLHRQKRSCSKIVRPKSMTIRRGASIFRGLIRDLSPLPQSRIPEHRRVLQLPNHRHHYQPLPMPGAHVKGQSSHQFYQFGSRLHQGCQRGYVIQYVGSNGRII